jgi:hypothetical protein
VGYTLPKERAAVLRSYLSLVGESQPSGHGVPCPYQAQRTEPRQGAAEKPLA